MSDRCSHCETPYSDERDENGLPFCDCDGAERERLDARLKNPINDLIQDVINASMEVAFALRHTSGYAESRKRLVAARNALFYAVVLKDAEIAQLRSDLEQSMTIELAIRGSKLHILEKKDE